MKDLFSFSQDLTKNNHEVALAEFYKATGTSSKKSMDKHQVSNIRAQMRQEMLKTISTGKCVSDVAQDTARIEQCCNRHCQYNINHN
jgi:hypothetical protein